MAQTQFNRWQAQPVATPRPAYSSAQRGASIVRAKAVQDSVAALQRQRQDSLRIAAVADKMPLLQRGLGQRIKDKKVLAEDTRYSGYVRPLLNYPVEALRAQTEGDITFKLLLDATGKVVRMHLVESTIPPGAVGETSMVQQARLILRQLRFEPATTTSEEEFTIGYKIQ
ncbi:energy transducer TonB [Hymenobacter tenuis]